MAIDKLIPQYLSSDTDQKLVKSVEMTDNLNVRVSNNAEGTAGVIKNIKGTEALSPKTPADAFPVGDNRVIGSVDNDKNKEVLFFLWNSNGDHGIYRINSLTDTFQKVYEDSVLGFQKLSFVDCDVVINEEEETLLYWTDNVNPPMKINVNRALSNGYPATFISGTDEEKLEALTVAKRPPQEVITFEFFTNESVKKNNLRDSLFQFAYQYVYTDGEVSALSAYSKITYSNYQTIRGLISESEAGNENGIRLFVPQGNDNVVKIRLFARVGNNGNFFQIEEIDNDQNIEYEFYNDGAYRFLSEDETKKMFDSVPQKAKSLVLSNNRLFLGNYVEGYDNVETDTLSYPVYKRVPLTYDISADINPTTQGDTEELKIEYGNSNNVTFNINVLDLPNTLKAGTFLSFNVEFSATETVDAYDTSALGILKYVDITWDDNGTSQTDTLSLGANNSFPLKIAIDSVSFSYSKLIDTDTSKQDVVNDIVSYLLSRNFVTTVSPDLNSNTHRSFGGNNFYVWVSGASRFSLVNGTYDSNTGNILFAIRFEGADLYISKIVKNTTEITLESQGGFELPKINGSANKAFAWNNFKNNYVSSSIAEDISSSPSFKTRANHEFGIVYYDDRNRNGGVNKIDKVYVSGYAESERTGNLGGVEIDFRIKHTAPSWAKKWQLVYSKNTSYDKFLQYSVSEAFAAQNTDSATTSASEGQRIYVSLRSLEGKENSYKDGRGAKIEYKFEEGDILQILKYEEGYSKRPRGYEFRILDYKYLNDDDENPIVLPAQRGFRHTGWFLVLSSEEYSGFTYEDVLGDTDLWGQNVVVEITSQKKRLEEQIYFETGKVYDVINNIHVGDRDTSAPIASDIFVSYAGTDSGFAESLNRFYIGDNINIGTQNLVITSIRYQSNGYIGYEFTYKSNTQVTAGYYPCTIANYTDAVVTTIDGDVYFRPRNIRYNPYDSANGIYDETAEESTVYALEYVEDYSLNDFFTSNSVSIGRPQAYSDDFKQIRRKSSITYSDAYVIDSDRLNLSSFNLSLANWNDMSLEYGGIDKMISRGDAITVIQESKASQVPLGRNLIEYASGDTGVTVSKNVLGTPSYYAGDYGSSGNPESVVERFGVVYFSDLNSRKVIRLSADGITPISDKGMDSYFQKLFEDLDKNVVTPKIAGGFDPDNGEYLLTVEDFSQSTITVGSSVYEVEVTQDGDYEPTPTYTSTQIIWNTIPFNWNQICQEWDEVGNGYLEVDGVFYIDSLLQGSTGTVTILVTDAENSFVAVATYDLGTGVVTMPSQTCDGVSIITKFGGAESSGVTISYKHKEGVWSSKYSFLPSNYASIGNTLYSFFQNDNGLAWKHNVNENRNLIYGEQYSSMFEVVSNYNPSMIKVYQALGIEGNGNWTSVIENSRQETEILEFDEREGHRYAMIPRDTINSTSHQIYLGVVESVNGNKVTFSTPVNRLPFIIGDYLKTAVGNTLSTTGVSIVSLEDRRTIVCSGIGVNVGENVFVEHSSIIDGDPIRDVYASIKLTSNDTEPFEVHAVSAHYDRSMLHNERVN